MVFSSPNLCCIIWDVIECSAAAILESRVPGLLRLLFRLSALEFYEYRISYSLHMLSWSGQDNYDPSLQFERNTARTIKGCRKRGSVITDLADCCIPDGRLSFEEREELKRKGYRNSCSAFTLTPETSARDRARLLHRAKSQLCALLDNSTSCTAMRQNVEAITKLMPFIIEYTANMESKETICDRLLDSFLTGAVFWTIGERKVKKSAAAPPGSRPAAAQQFPKAVSTYYTGSAVVGAGSWVSSTVGLSQHWRACGLF